VLAFSGLLGLLVASASPERYGLPVLLRCSRPAKWFIAAVGVTLSALVLALVAAISQSSFSWALLDISQSLVTASWILFLSRLGSDDATHTDAPTLYDKIGVIAGVLLVGALFTSIPASFTGLLSKASVLQLRHLSQLLLGFLGLLAAIVVYLRATRAQKWAYKYLCIAVGIIFAHDIWLYSDVILSGQIDQNLLIVWGFILAMTSPLLALASVRIGALGFSPFVSRTAVLNGTAVLVATLYVLLVASIGYVIQTGFGVWSEIILAIFLAAATIVLLALLTSNRIQSHTRVMISKHFFRYRYDYRNEWLRLTRTLSDSEALPDLRLRAIRALGELVGCRWGQLWTRDGSRGYSRSATWKEAPPGPGSLGNNDPLVTFLSEKGWVVDIKELDLHPALYDGLKVPEWLHGMRDAWVVTPLYHLGSLLGIAVLGAPTTRHDLNWEDHDLLKAAGQQVSSYLALINTTEELVRARQFETLNRLSAYVLHDLKNISAQLSLVCANGKRFSHNKEFLDDAFSTIESATQKVDTMVADLRKCVRRESSRHAVVSVQYVLERVVKRRASRAPAPVIKAIQGNPLAMVVPHRFERILEHLIQNAQEATPPNGRVEVSACIHQNEARISVVDSGGGMDESFVRTRLFEPFDTTKGNAGLGIGVYESRQTAEEFGGRLEVISTPGKGSTFSLYLPLATTTPAPQPTECAAEELQ
jgi:putative PEP-CTERM system histidine kinase